MTLFSKRTAASAILGLLLVAPPVWAATNILHEAPRCGCCKTYGKYLEANRIAVTGKPTRSYGHLTTLAKQAGVPDQWTSEPMGVHSGICHFTSIEGYTIVGHVPVEAIHKLLKEKPHNVAGIIVPGMPMGSPGMGGTQRKPLVVYAFDREGKSWIFASVPPAGE